MPVCNATVTPSGTSGEGQKIGTETTPSFKTPPQPDADTNNPLKFSQSRLTVHVNAYSSSYNVTLPGDMKKKKKKVAYVGALGCTSGKVDFRVARLARRFGGFMRQLNKISL